MALKALLVKENRGYRHTERQRDVVAYPSSHPTLENDQVKRWKKQAERDEESYWRRKFGEMI